ncbi:MAG: hypothetical protein HYX97_03975 [Chloroflexi bacterium]|nr:hypothetical protein [Chloroflexota bacterium]
MSKKWLFRLLVIGGLVGALAVASSVVLADRGDKGKGKEGHSPGPNIGRALGRGNEGHGPGPNFGRALGKDREDEHEMRLPPITRHMVRGEVKSISASSLVIGDGDKSITVLVDSDTTFHITGNPGAGLDAIAVGDVIMALGQHKEDKTFEARMIVKLPQSVLQTARRAHRGTVTGTLAAKVSDSITVTTERQGDLAIALTSETKYRVPGKEDATLADFNVGDKVLVRVNKNGEALEALVVAKRPAEKPGRPVVRSGDVTAVSATSLTISSFGGAETTTFIMTAETEVRLPDGQTALAVGDKVMVQGRYDADANTLTAERVRVQPPAPTPTPTATPTPTPTPTA